MISIEDFKVASFEKKCYIITRSTDYIISRETEDEKIYLYHTGNFFIEVYYSPMYKRVLRINTFTDALNLEPYIVDISLRELTS